MKFFTFFKIIGLEKRFIYFHEGSPESKPDVPKQVPNAGPSYKPKTKDKLDDKDFALLKTFWDDVKNYKKMYGTDDLATDQIDRLIRKLKQCGDESPNDTRLIELRKEVSDSLPAMLLEYTKKRMRNLRDGISREGDPFSAEMSALGIINTLRAVAGEFASTENVEGKPYNLMDYLVFAQDFEEEVKKLHPSIYLNYAEKAVNQIMTDQNPESSIEQALRRIEEAKKEKADPPKLIGLEEKLKNLQPIIYLRRAEEILDNFDLSTGGYSHGLKHQLFSDAKKYIEKAENIGVDKTALSSVKEKFRKIAVKIAQEKNN